MKLHTEIDAQYTSKVQETIRQNQLRKEVQHSTRNLPGSLLSLLENLLLPVHLYHSLPQNLQ